ncbi:uncharacterized protein LOC105849366 isoform X2 [Hydra vulgaris]|uniref:uncharacterized protein LOC105849366 isoform X2 n=1 Tax=Hydra vulgaris TaxID=6087 RepID=UPI001F5F1477|nr:uncharacterized protein LOC105849366 isoform X2 [Hydra vulgaris]
MESKSSNKTTSNKRLRSTNKSKKKRENLKKIKSIIQQENCDVLLNGNYDDCEINLSQKIFDDSTNINLIENIENSNKKNSGENNCEKNENKIDVKAKLDENVKQNIAQHIDSFKQTTDFNVSDTKNNADCSQIAVQLTQETISTYSFCNEVILNNTQIVNEKEIVLNNTQIVNEKEIVESNSLDVSDSQLYGIEVEDYEESTKVAIEKMIKSENFGISVWADDSKLLADLTYINRLVINAGNASYGTK